MFFKNRIFTFVSVSFLIATVLASNSPAFIKRNINEHILNLITRSGDLMTRNSDSFPPCFASYLSEMNVVSDKYEKDYAACGIEADGRRSTMESESLDFRNGLANRTETSCATLKQCKEVSSVDKVYECYVDGGSDNAKVLHVISNDAFSELANYMENSRIINNNENRCTNKTRETYEYERVAAYDDFKDCLLGRVKEPSPSPIPSPTPTPTPGPEPISTTTEES